MPLRRLRVRRPDARAAQGGPRRAAPPAAAQAAGPAPRPPRRAGFARRAAGARSGAATRSSTSSRASTTPSASCAPRSATRPTRRGSSRRCPARLPVHRAGRSAACAGRARSTPARMPRSPQSRRRHTLASVPRRSARLRWRSGDGPRRRGRLALAAAYFGMRPGESRERHPRRRLSSSDRSPSARRSGAGHRSRERHLCAARGSADAVGAVDSRAAPAPGDAERRVAARRDARARRRHRRDGHARSLSWRGLHDVSGAHGLVRACCTSGRRAVQPRERHRRARRRARCGCALPPRNRTGSAGATRATAPPTATTSAAAPRWSSTRPRARWRAIEAFESALRRDPPYALARAGLAMACADMYLRFAGPADVERWGERAEAEARAALGAGCRSRRSPPGPRGGRPQARVRLERHARRQAAGR